MYQRSAVLFHRHELPYQCSMSNEALLDILKNNIDCHNLITSMSSTNNLD